MSEVSWMPPRRRPFRPQLDAILLYAIIPALAVAGAVAVFL